MMPRSTEKTGKNEMDEEKKEESNRKRAFEPDSDEEMAHAESICALAAASKSERTSASDYWKNLHELLNNLTSTFSTPGTGNSWAAQVFFMEARDIPYLKTKMNQVVSRLREIIEGCKSSKKLSESTDDQKAITKLSTIDNDLQKLGMHKNQGEELKRLQMEREKLQRKKESLQSDKERDANTEIIQMENQTELESMQQKFEIIQRKYNREQEILQLEKQILQLEKQILQLENERKDSEKEILRLENQKLQLEKQILQLENERKDREKEILQLMGQLTTYVSNVVSATTNVQAQLRSLSSLSQAQGSVHTLGTGTREAIQEECKKQRNAPVPLPAVINEEDSYRSILDNARDLEVDQVSDDELLIERLLFVHESLDNYLDKARFINHADGFSSKAYKLKIQEEMERLYKRVHDGLRQRSASPNSQNDDASAKILSGLEQQHTAPGAHAFEVEGTQQWLSVVTRLVGECLRPPYIKVRGNAGTISPVKTKYFAERIIKDISSDRPIRKCDMMLAKDGRHAFIIFDDSMQLGGEEKPGSRDGAGPGKLFLEGIDQGLSHCAKSVGVGFNFAGPGVPTHATMFVSNMAAIQVLQLRLEDVGTPEAKLVLYKSRLHPFLSTKQYDAWAASAKEARQADFASFKKLIYGDQLERGFDKQGIPYGFHVLCNLMQMRRMELFGPTVQAEGDILGDVLGTGSFSAVFVHKTNPTCAVKLSRYGKCNDLLNESTILSQLGEDGPNVSKVISYHEKLQVNFQSVTWKLPALVTSPVGVSSLLACVSAHKGGNELSWLKMVLDGLEAALSFIHGKGVIHRDVNPNNVIIVDGDGSTRPVLIDFSIAVKANEKATGFSGTVNFTHRKIFEYYPRTEHVPCAKHDQASLGFTMAMFVNGGSLPWSPIVGFPKTLNNGNKPLFLKQANARLASAISVTNELYSTMSSGEVATVGERITELLKLDEEDRM